jgi:predicted CoA-binding protein
VRTWCDPEMIKRLLTTPATCAIVGLSAKANRIRYRISQYLRDELGMTMVPVNLRRESALGAEG